MATLTPRTLSSLLEKGTSQKDLEKFMKKSGKEVLTKKDETGQSVVHVIATEGNVKLLKYLSDKMKVSLEERDKNDWRPIHYASVSGKLELISFLIKRGVSVNSKTSENATCLHYFSKIPPPKTQEDEALYLETLNKIINKFDNINAQNKTGQTPLHKAVSERKRTLLIRTLLEHKAEVNIKDCAGETALHIGTRTGNIEIVTMLLEHGADITLKSSVSGTPYHISKEIGAEDITKLFDSWAQKIGINKDDILLNGKKSSKTLANNSTASLGERLEKQYLVDIEESAAEKQRRDPIRLQNIFKELMASEKNYVQMLKCLVVHTKTCVLQNNALEEQDIATVFSSDLEAIFNAHKLISKIMKSKMRAGLSPLEAFHHFYRIHDNYLNYTKTLNTRLALLKDHLQENKTFQKIARRVEVSKTSGQKILTLFIYPLAQISRYSELLHSLKLYLPGGDAHIKIIKKLLTTVEKINDQILEIKKKEESRSVILQIQNSLQGYNESLYNEQRYLIYEGPLLVRPDWKNKKEVYPCQIYLFNDIVLWAKKIVSDKGVKSLQYYDQLRLKFVTRMSEDETDTKNSFEVSSELESKSILFSADSGDSIIEWISRLGRAISLESVRHKWRTLDFKKPPIPALASHTSNIVGSHLYIFGGRCRKYSNDMYQFDLEEERWDLIPSSSKAPPPRCEHASASDGAKIYICGGFDGKTRLKDMYIFNTETSEWSRVKKSKSSPEGRSGHQIIIRDQKLYLFGGIDSTGQYLNDFYEMPLNTPGQWTSVSYEGKAPEPRAFHSMCVLNENIVIFGGNSFSKCFDDLYVFNMKESKWIPMRMKEGYELKPPARFMQASFVSNNMLVIQGGCSKGTNSYYDMWGLKIEGESYYWISIELDLQLEYRFRHTISSFVVDEISYAIMYGGITGSSTSMLTTHDTVIFKGIDQLLNKYLKKSQTIKHSSAQRLSPKPSQDVELKKGKSSMHLKVKEEKVPKKPSKKALLIPTNKSKKRS